MQQKIETASAEFSKQRGDNFVQIEKLKYLGSFFLFFILLTLLDLRLEKRTDYGLARVERMWKGSSPIFTSVENQGSTLELSKGLGVDWEDLQTGQFVVDSYIDRLETRNPVTWNRLLYIDYGDYRLFLGTSILLNAILAGIFAAVLYLREGLTRSNVLILSQTVRQEKLNEQLEARVEEREKIIRRFNRLRHKLVEAEKLASIGRLSATLAHEIRNPLSIIKSSTEIVSDEVSEDGSAAAAVALIREEVERMDRIITDLLRFARPKQPNLEHQNLKSLVRHWLPHIVEELEKDGIQVVPQFEEFDGSVVVDADQLYQVFLNLVFNARDALAGHPNPHLFVRTGTDDGDYGQLIIQDTGSGMLPEHLRQIREPFYTTKTQGTGLGVPVSIQLLQNMGGRLEIDSEVEVGTTVTLYLRRSDAKVFDATQEIDIFLQDYATETEDSTGLPRV